MILQTRSATSSKEKSNLRKMPATSAGDTSNSMLCDSRPVACNQQRQMTSWSLSNNCAWPASANASRGGSQGSKRKRTTAAVAPRSASTLPLAAPRLPAPPLPRALRTKMRKQCPPRKTNAALPRSPGSSARHVRADARRNSVLRLSRSSRSLAHKPSIGATNSSAACLAACLRNSRLSSKAFRCWPKRFRMSCTFSLDSMAPPNSFASASLRSLKQKSSNSCDLAKACNPHNSLSLSCDSVALGNVASPMRRRNCFSEAAASCRCPSASSRSSAASDCNLISDPSRELLVP
mmetsp:Transcript_95336/g.308873  ORF Transcript_95336/g.308873 Transcript_95336/m.308873 type:complete len:292 (+) Transcript_95336:316-1191(+)